MHLFDAEGRFLERIRQTTPPGGLLFRLHVAPISDSSFLVAETHAMDFRGDAGAPRERLDLRRIRPGSSDGGADSRRVFGRVRNQLATLPSPPGRGVPNSLFLTAYGRLWDALGTGLAAIVSLDRHGVCFFDGDRRLVGAYRVDAPTVPVDASRKERILDEHRDKWGPSPPMGGTESWDEFYDHWPEALPRYLDVSLRRDSTAWIYRPVEETRFSVKPDVESSFAVDVIHARRGYLGSYRTTEFPEAFRNECALFVKTTVPEDAGTETLADSAFHGLVERCPER